METKEKQSIISSLPVCTLSILFISIITFISSDVSSFFIYERVAILNGEIWRLVTGHLVHFNIPHQLYNLIAFGMMGWMIEHKKCRHFFLLCLLISFSIGIFLVIVKTEIAFYGGLSGLACGLLIYLALAGLRDKGPWRTLCCAMLFIVPIKIFFEVYVGESILPYPKGASFTTMWEAHAIGSLIALLAFAIQNFIIIRLGNYKTTKTLTHVSA